MAKVNTIANNGLTIVENYNKLLEQFRKTKTIDDVRILVASVRDFISVYKRVDSVCSTKPLPKSRTTLDTRGERLRCFEFDEMDGI